MSRKYDYSTELCDIATSFLKEQELAYIFDADTGIFRFSIGTDSCFSRLQIYIDVHENQILVYTFCPLSADIHDTQVMQEMTRFTCLANYGTKNGAFEFDLRDGELRHRCFIDCDGVLPPVKVIRNAVYIGTLTMQKYASAICEIMFAGVSADAAYEKAKRPENNPLLGVLSAAQREEILEALREQSHAEEEDDSDSSGEESE